MPCPAIGPRMTMVALKTSEIESFVARPDPSRAVVLVFGPDAGLVSERVDAIVRASVDDPDDPFSLVRLDGDTTRVRSGAPGRRGHDRSAVRRTPRDPRARRQPQHRAGGRSRARRAAARLPRRDRGRRSEAQRPLRTLCERAKNAVAIPCYADGERDIGAADRRGDARRRADDRARRARRARPAARRRPPRLARRAAQARALCAAARSASSSTTSWRWWRTPPRSRSMRWSMRPSPASSPTSRRSSPRRWSPAHRRSRSSARRCARSSGCTCCA